MSDIKNLKLINWIPDTDLQDGIKNRVNEVKIGIIGLGVVGSANKYGFEKVGHEVLVHDIKLKTNINNIKDSKIVFLCVPTPSNKNGSCNTSLVEKTLSDLDKINYEGIICNDLVQSHLLKSNVLKIKKYVLCLNF